MRRREKAFMDAGGYWGIVAVGALVLGGVIAWKWYRDRKMAALSQDPAVRQAEAERIARLNMQYDARVPQATADAAGRGQVAGFRWN